MFVKDIYLLIYGLFIPNFFMLTMLYKIFKLSGIIAE